MGKKKRSFEELMEELEQTIAQLEAGELPLEESLAKYEKGIAAFRQCREILDQAEKRIQLLLKDEKGELQVKDFEPEAEET